MKSISASSPLADDSCSQPQTPPDLSPSSSQPKSPPAVDVASGGKKRKQIRRVNTAERRASHNAVERQRRDTLNGRFLDLAAILPNLSQIRRPSKSAIVNSSIAYFHASRRHRLVASRELRMLKFETDALRRELNDWRTRASIRRVQEPTRSDGFSLVLSGELEIFSVDGVDDDDGEDDLYTPVVPPDDNSEHPFDDPSAASVRRNDMRPPQVPQNLSVSYPVHRQMTDCTPMPMIVSPGSMVTENPVSDMAYNALNGVPPFDGMQNKWSEQGHPSEQGFFGSFEGRRSYERERPHEGRKATPKGPAGQYFDLDWNNVQNGNINGNNHSVPFGLM